VFSPDVIQRVVVVVIFKFKYICGLKTYLWFEYQHIKDKFDFKGWW